MSTAGTIHIGTFEAKNKLSSLVEQASKGTRIWITKRGKRVALLSSGSEQGGSSEADPLVCFRRIRSRSGKTGGKGTSIKALLQEGRR